MIRRLRRVPLPLALLLVVATIQALAWIVLMPPLQGPDEVSHFTYVQRIAEKKEIPWTPSGEGEPGDPYSTEVNVAMNIAGLGPLAGNIAARPYWTSADQRLWSQHAEGAARDDAGYTSALRNPPLYYLYGTVPYYAASGGTFFDRQLLLRLGNIPFLLATLVFTWLLVGELLGAGVLRFLATAVAALVPQLLNVVATVNPDTMLVAIWSVALYVMALVLRRGASPRLVAALAVLCAAGALTQPRSIPLVIPAITAVVLAQARRRGWNAVTPARAGLATLALYVPVVLVWAGRGAGNTREFLSYVWQFYLPKLGSMDPTIGPDDYDLRSGFVARIFGTLAQLEVVLPSGIEEIGWWVARLGLVALAIALVVKRDAVKANAGLAVLFLSAIVSLLLGLHLVAYRAMLGNPGDPIITGRYLLPLVALLGLAAAIIAGALPRFARPVYVGVVLAAGVALQIISLGLLLERFYA